MSQKDDDRRRTRETTTTTSEEWYRPGNIPREKYIHAETTAVWKDVFVWCVYMRSGRMEENEMPRLEVALPSACRAAVIAGDFNTASSRARDATLRRLRVTDAQIDRWAFPCTTNKRRSLLQCQLDKIYIETLVVESDDDDGAMARAIQDHIQDLERTNLTCTCTIVIVVL